ncbi:MAG: hypothetical protein Q9195_001961 [Heterodermia aff. obscurata]
MASPTPMFRQDKWSEELLGGLKDLVEAYWVLEPNERSIQANVLGNYISAVQKSVSGTQSFVCVARFLNQIVAIRATMRGDDLASHRTQTKEIITTLQNILKAKDGSS